MKITTCPHVFERPHWHTLESFCRYCGLRSDTVIACYADGGVAGRNPSKTGGTWAYLHISATGKILVQSSGTVVPSEVNLPAITNNLTEMLAVIEALEALPDGWAGEVYSDSQVTLGRLFRGWAQKGIPDLLQARLSDLRKRLDWRHCRGILLDGHPTKAHLTAGRGSRGNLVSIHNQTCDTLCRTEAKKLLLAAGSEAALSSAEAVADKS